MVQTSISSLSAGLLRGSSALLLVKDVEEFHHLVGFLYLHANHHPLVHDNGESGEDIEDGPSTVVFFAHVVS
jgi:hypothetical protein